MKPLPNAADIRAAEATYAANRDKFGMAHDRSDYIARLARYAMQERLQREHREALTAKHRRAA